MSHSVQGPDCVPILQLSLHQSDWFKDMAVFCASKVLHGSAPVPVDGPPGSRWPHRRDCRCQDPEGCLQRSRAGWARRRKAHARDHVPVCTCACKCKSGKKQHGKGPCRNCPSRCNCGKNSSTGTALDWPVSASVTAICASSAGSFGFLKRDLDRVAKRQAGWDESSASMRQVLTPRSRADLDDQ